MKIEIEDCFDHNTEKLQMLSFLGGIVFTATPTERSEHTVESIKFITMVIFTSHTDRCQCFGIKYETENAMSISDRKME
ncbi:unnamed protein product [Toxocara canis]|uniref:Uncharacterized protein n=1 Tax=Toxocara canis TaxID=6265 RepID=A0A183UAU2_TOXCA|nr:unnamed protein product [Toxocara canis]